MVKKQNSERCTADKNSRAYDPFKPHWLLKNAFLQTVAPVMVKNTAQLTGVAYDIALNPGSYTRGFYFSSTRSSTEESVTQVKTLVVLLHGLGGSSDSVYIQRVTPLLVEKGFDVLQVNFRNAGPALGMADGIYHSGRTEDLRMVLNWAAHQWDNKEIVTVGYSLGANILLKYLGEGEVNQQVVQALAICPPFRLSASSRWMSTGFKRMFQLYILNDLKRQVSAMGIFQQYRPQFLKAKSILEFDEGFTAPVNGFASAEDYYEQCSCGPYLQSVRVPTHILVSQDDPVVSSHCVSDFELSDSITLTKTQTGGHLGFVEFKNGKIHNWLDQFILREISKRSLNK